MNKLTDRNDEIFRRWKAGENHCDLADEFKRTRHGVAIMLRGRSAREETGREYVPGPSNKELGELYRPRNEAIVAGRKAGLSYNKLGAQFGLSRERIRQIWVRYLNPTPAQEKRQAKQERQRRVRERT